MDGGQLNWSGVVGWVGAYLPSKCCCSVVGHSCPLHGPVISDCFAMPCWPVTCLIHASSPQAQLGLTCRAWLIDRTYSFRSFMPVIFNNLTSQTPPTIASSHMEPPPIYLPPPPSSHSLADLQFTHFHPLHPLFFMLRVYKIVSCVVPFPPNPC